MNNNDIRIYINNDMDIVLARVQTREIARKMGFNTADQARVSLAASELARLLSWAKPDKAEMIISKTTRNGHQGMQVNCQVHPELISGEDCPDETSQAAIPSRIFVGARRLVDESNIDVQNNEQALVTLIKWLR